MNFLAWKAAREAAQGIRELAVDDFMDANSLDFDEGRGIFDTDEIEADG